jgi:hypothetical protein
MRQIVIFLFLICPSIGIAQTDSMFVEMMNGSIRGYPITIINGITFSKEGPVSVREEQMMQNVLSSFAVYQNYPNPFNPSTTIQYTIPQNGQVKVNIFDIQGRLIRSFNNEIQQSGNHSLIWNSRDNSGIVVSSGTYLCQVLFINNSLVKKLLLLK